MITTAIRTKEHKYIDEANDQILEVYNKDNESLLPPKTQLMVMERSASYKSGKSKGYSIKEAKKRNI